MQDIWNIINEIGKFISTIWNFIQKIIDWLIEAVNYLILAVDTAYDFISDFPDWLKYYAIATITICIIYTILGWAGGNSE